jgi:hypothetical protein
MQVGPPTVHLEHIRNALRFLDRAAFNGGWLKAATDTIEEAQNTAIHARALNDEVERLRAAMECVRVWATSKDERETEVAFVINQARHRVLTILDAALADA